MADIHNDDITAFIRVMCGTGICMIVVSYLL